MSVQTESIRRCSYCRQVGHYVSTCSSRNIINFENECVWIIENNVCPQNSWHQFRRWLVEYYIQNSRNVRAYACKRFHIGYSSHIGACIDIIDAHFKTYYINHILPEYNRQHNISSGVSIDSQMVSLFIHMIQEIYRNHGEPSYSVETNSDRKFDILVSLSNPEDYNGDELEKGDKSENKNTCGCSICLDDNISKTEMITLIDCNHTFCKSCIVQSLETEKRSVACCALCRRDITKIETYTENNFTDIVNMDVIRSSNSAN